MDRKSETKPSTDHPTGELTHAGMARDKSKQCNGQADPEECQETLTESPVSGGQNQTPGGLFALGYVHVMQSLHVPAAFAPVFLKTTLIPSRQRSSTPTSVHSI